MRISGISLLWLLISGALVTPVGISSALAIQSVPFSPTHLNATAISGTQIFLVWSPPVNASQSVVTGYRIEASPSCTNSYNFLTNTTATSFVSSVLTNGTCYQFRVEAINTSGFSTPSNIASATTLSVPSAPSLSAIAISSSQVNLSWTAPGSTGGTPIKGYKIQRENSCTGSFVAVANTNSSTAYSDLGLSANTCYKYKVFAINAIGTGPASNNATATTLPSPVQIHVPSVPIGLAVTTVSSTSLKLNWNKPADNGGAPITGYLIQRNGTIIVNNTFSNNTSYIDTNLSPFHLQTYQVAAWNSAGQSLVSNSAFGITTIQSSGNSTNQTSSNLGQLVSALIHERNQLLKQQRQETITVIHDCNTQIKNASPDARKQIQEDCKTKIKEIREKYKVLQQNLKEQLQAIKTTFKEVRHEQEEHSDKKELDHSENQTKHIEKDLKHSEKKFESHGNSAKHKHVHQEDD